jgi:phosphoribosylaminoimidazole carboxylase PurK protein
MLLKEKPLGILGDGQLALLLAEAAEKHHIAFTSFRSPPFNQESLAEFARRVSWVTLENEFFSVGDLKTIEAAGTPVVPPAKDFAHFADKISQRKFFEAAGVPGPRFLILDSSIQGVVARRKAIEECFLEAPVVLKASQGGYDGYGVRFAKVVEERSRILEEFGDRDLLVEEWVDLQCELAQGALFRGEDPPVLLPLVETKQKDGICIWVSTRPRVNASTQTMIVKILQSIAQMKLTGLFNFEFFVTQSNEILMNEGAPRPHNSQHVTIDASDRSQFDLLVQLFAGELKRTDPVQARNAMMVNLLGRSQGTNVPLVLPTLPSGIEVLVKMYGKAECRIGRKMGHVNLLAEEGFDLRPIAEKVFKEYQL